MARGPERLPSFGGRTAVVTGANSGIGWQTAAQLAERGAVVTLACRRLEAARQARDRICTRHPAAHVRVTQLDLASLSSVASFAGQWRGPLDLLVNNAGVMAPSTWRPTEDGFELQFGVNHLGHFALTARLLPALLCAESPRVVTVSSLAHRSGGTDVVDGNPAATYRPQPAYANSKLANLLFARELQRRAAEHHSRLTSTAAHPGLSATGLVRDREGMGSMGLVRLVSPLILKVILQPAAHGANPTLYAATQAPPGSYSGPQRFGETRGPVGPATTSPIAQDGALASKLWDVSERLTGLRYRWPTPPPNAT